LSLSGILSQQWKADNTIVVVEGRSYRGKAELQKVLISACDSLSKKQRLCTQVEGLAQWLTSVIPATQEVET
jgi:hypothetical protein